MVCYRDRFFCNNNNNDDNELIIDVYRIMDLWPGKYILWFLLGTPCCQQQSLQKVELISGYSLLMRSDSYRRWRWKRRSGPGAIVGQAGGVGIDFLDAVRVLGLSSCNRVYPLSPPLEPLLRTLD
jgi:hypothetical protein